MEACWAHNPGVGRSKLPPANFFPRISERKEIETLTSNQQKRIRRNLHFIAYEAQNKMYSSQKIVTPAGWRSGSVLGP